MLQPGAAVCRFRVMLYPATSGSMRSMSSVLQSVSQEPLRDRKLLIRNQAYPLHACLDATRNLGFAAVLPGPRLSTSLP